MPILIRGEDANPDQAMRMLETDGSFMVPGFKNPEGIVVWHSAARQCYKMTFKEDGGKWKSAPPHVEVKFTSGDEFAGVGRVK